MQEKPQKIAPYFTLARWAHLTKKIDIQSPGTDIYKMRKTQVNTEEMHRISCSYVSLTRRAHKLDEMGTTSKMHLRIKTTAHLSAVQRKAGPEECHLGSTDPLGRPTP